MIDLVVIRECFVRERVYYTSHARREMRTEAFGVISEEEVNEAIEQGEVIESYPDDTPYPSGLIYGCTGKGRPLHIVCAQNEHDTVAVVITVYHPDPGRWVDYRRRKK